MGKLSMYKFVAPEFVFGTGSRKLAGRYARIFGARHLFVATDPGVIKAGWVDEVLASVTEENISYTLYSDISPNPRDHEVMQGATLYLKNKCDCILAIGGGSVIDCAKGVGIVCTNNKNILTFEGVDKVEAPMPPLICVPTTGGTSADVSQFAIINDIHEKVKIAIISKSLVPDIALIDPETLLSMDRLLTACTGIDALVHAIEAYVSNAASSITDIHALEAINLIMKNLLLSIEHPGDITYREKIMEGSLHAGLAFSNASLGCTHAMAHSLGGYLDLPHGECNALLLPHVIDYNLTHAEQRFRDIAAYMNIPSTNTPAKTFHKEFVDEVISFRKQAGILSSLAQKGVTPPVIDILSAKAIKDPCNATNPRVPVTDDLKHIFLEAL